MRCFMRGPELNVCNITVIEYNKSKSDFIEIVLNIFVTISISMLNYLTLTAEPCFGTSWPILL